MKRSLGTWQFISLVSRGSAVAIGIIQSIFLVRILSVSDYGVVQLAVSLGGYFGIYQHLGLGSGSTREIAAAKDKHDIFKIFVTSALIRYLMVIPIVAFLFLSANRLAVSTYHIPELEQPLKLFALVLVAQGLQSILNSVISGMQRFKTLFVYQTAIAFLSLALYLPLVYVYKVNGYFYAMLSFNLLATCILWILAFRPLAGMLKLPNQSDLKRISKDLFSISMAIYAVKILYNWWEKAGPVVLGQSASPEIIGIFSFGLLYAKKLMHISDATTDVNLPVFSDEYVNNFSAFKALFTKNFDKIYTFILFTAFSVVFWAAPLIRLIAKGPKYDASVPLILPIVFAFVCYSFINIIKASLLIPAKLVKEMVVTYVLLYGVTLGFVYVLTTTFKLSVLFSMGTAMLIGAVVSMAFAVYTTQQKLAFTYFTLDHGLIAIQALVIAGSYHVFSTGFHPLLYKSALYVTYLILFSFATVEAKFITKQDLLASFEKVAKLKSLLKKV